MKLTAYKQKRNLKKSGESKPKISKLKSKKIFVVQFHQATHDHYDLRLEINKVLKSWAIPKQPPKTKNIKRLAIQVEDHPLDYADFQGTIPKGNYGAGKVEIWDKGTYELIDAEGDPLGKKDSDTPQAYTKEVREPLRGPETFFKKMFTRGKIIFKLHGKKLKGKYCLIKTNYLKNKKGWLFFKI